MYLTHLNSKATMKKYRAGTTHKPYEGVLLLFYVLAAAVRIRNTCGTKCSRKQHKHSKNNKGAFLLVPRIVVVPRITIKILSIVYSPPRPPKSLNLNLAMMINGCIHSLPSRPPTPPHYPALITMLFVNVSVASSSERGRFACSRNL